ncbi:zinc-binding dehydrogenase [Streptomyces sp. NBC_01276]|uniref:zinc-binding dehydrogenase n=1 Tax=Streptomyces sp. NBC_01276 TaxID=2903808 RepID=UPI00352E047A
MDTGGNRSLSRLRRALTPRGTVVIVGGEGGGRWIGGFDRLLRAQLLSPFVRQRLCGLGAVPRTAELATLAELIDSGAVTPAVDRCYPLDEVPEAIRRLRSGAVRGKLVIRT